MGFSRYIPHVVVVAIGQNDNHPVDYMAEDYDSENPKLEKTLSGIHRKTDAALSEGADHFSNHDPLP